VSPGFVESEFRQVDNQGKHHAQAAESIPRWLIKSTASAAKEMVRAIEARKAEQVITFHGKVLLWLKRFAPWLIELVLNFGVKSRPEPRSR
jgi:short-subunit dehydrogenase